VGLVDDFIKTKVWAPSSKTVAIVSSNDPFSLNISKSFQAAITKLGWKTTMFQQFSAPQADWTATLVNIRNKPPGIVFFSDYAAGDEAAFIKQFRQSPTPSLVYQLYAPSIPQYLQLAGNAADGVLWSTTVGILEKDSVADPFTAAFQRKFNASAGFSNAGQDHDAVRVWANAAAQAGDPYDFAKVNERVKATIYRGVCGTMNWPDDYQTVYSYPYYSKDPSLAMPLLTFQIQNGNQVLISPEPYARGSFQLPPWLKK
jgi:branched-chain amino acid transport system substrate-binding protein